MADIIKALNSILVTGATGYVGGRLVPLLVEKGYRVRCFVRDPSQLQGRDWDWERIEIVQGDALQYETLAPAMQDIKIAYYLIHSMVAGRGFREREHIAADNFSRAAAAAGVERIIYLSGLGSDTDTLSEHLKSRHETGELLRAYGIPVTEFRAAQIIGSGSISFEMLRYLTEGLPLIIGPKWLNTRSQPIGVRDVLRYLTDCLEVPASVGRILEIGGQDILTYREMMLAYARARGLKRRIYVTPLIRPFLSGHFINWVTPIPIKIVRPLLEGMKNEVIVHDMSAREIFGFSPMPYEEALARTLARIEKGPIRTIWSGSFASTGESPSHYVKLTVREGMMIEKRRIKVNASRSQVFKVFTSLGGEKGWLYADWLWWIRRVIDRALGGVGFRGGRRSAAELRVGDPVDFWRVEAYEKDHLLRLRAEMIVFGQAWLQFRVKPLDDSHVILTQTAFYEPKGLTGILYWYGLYPIHRIVFRGMIKAIAAEAETLKKTE